MPSEKKEDEVQYEPVDAVVNVLEKALEDAKRGEIISVAVVRIGRKNDFVTNYSIYDGNWSILHTAAEYFQYHLLNVTYSQASVAQSTTPPPGDGGK
jgi:hypothetical protein